MKTNFITLTLIMFAFGCKTPMTKLIKEKNISEVKARLASGEDPNANECDNPLIVASNRGDLELTQLLLEKGANPNLRSQECDYGNGYGRYKMGTRNALAEAKTLEIAKLLVTKGANLNLGSYREMIMTTATYTPPLREHIISERFEIANFLVDAGANLNVYTDEGKNLFISSLNNDKNIKNPEAIKLKAKIIAKGAKDFDFTKYKSVKFDRITSYTHNTYGGSTTMPNEFQSPLWENPLKFSPLTIYAVDNQYYHYSEFIDDTSKMNLHHWYIARAHQVSKSK